MATTSTSKQIEQFILEAGSDSLAVFGGAFEGGAHIQQVPDELAPCICDIIKSKKKITSMLEIGSAAGGTAYILGYFLSPETIVIIDDNRHPKHALRVDILKDMERREIIGSSRDPEVIDEARGQYDLIVIDGDHSYQGVKADFDSYFPMLSDNGFILFHDSATRQWGCDVPLLVEELREGGGVSLVGEYTSNTGPVCGLALFRKGGK